ncbi:protein TIFY 9 isoform X4 [Capsicum annuum]|uniref:protein TIFY 9 isoform X4 n=1 Tax=Capsicum annuum TaxID=4072 RepID=UPI001FB12B70|nr:protein TIFY 9 isoform X4 [Capsicum annuum]
MERSVVELDFFNMGKESTTDDVDSVIWKIDSTGSGNVVPAEKSASPRNPLMPRVDYSPLPVFSPSSRFCCGLESDAKIAPLTIFYNGTVAIFYVSKDKVDNTIVSTCILAYIIDQGYTMKVDDVTTS